MSPDDDWALGQNEVDVRNEARKHRNSTPSRIPYGEPDEPSDYAPGWDARMTCEACGEWIYTRRKREGGPASFPPNCQVCGTPFTAEQSQGNG